MMKNSKELKEKAWETLKNDNYWNLFLVNLLIILIVGVSNFLSIFLIGTLLVSQALMNLNVYRKKEFQFENMLEPFKKNFVNTLTTYLLKMVFIFLWSLLFVIPGIIKTFSYAMTDYILVDNPDLTANEAIKESQKMMNGNKLRLFILHLSFIGWYLLSILTLGIGLVFLIPYIKAAETAFYLDLVNENNIIINEEIEEVEIIIE